jgi:hypothetical protein
VASAAVQHTHDVNLLVYVQAEKLVAKLDALGATAGDLGLSLFKVAKFEVRLVARNHARGQVGEQHKD